MGLLILISFLSLTPRWRWPNFFQSAGAGLKKKRKKNKADVNL
jgi:hypothetical protein